MRRVTAKIKHISLQQTSIVEGGGEGEAIICTLVKSGDRTDFKASIPAAFRADLKDWDTAIVVVVVVVVVTSTVTASCYSRN